MESTGARPITRWPDVIVVNGPSSAGKTTLCTALRDAIPHPYLHVGFDDFILMSAPRYYRGTDTPSQEETDDATRLGVQMITTSAPGEPPAVVAQFGPVFRSLISAMAPAVRTLVDHGNPVIFDHVIHDQAMAESLAQAMKGVDVFSVGVTCPIEVLEAREQARGDRVIGRARGLADVVHRFTDYDVMVDTGSMDPDACVHAIRMALDARTPAPTRS